MTIHKHEKSVSGWGKEADTRASAELEKACTMSDRLHDFAEASERRFSNLVHGLNAIVWEMEVPSRHYTFVSQQAEQITSLSIEALFQDLDTWLLRVHADDRKRVEAAYQSAMADSRDESVEYRVATADGRVIWLHDYIHPARDAAGKGKQLRGVMLEITEHKEAEQALQESEHKFRSLAEEALVGVYLIQGGVFKYVNPRLAEIFGYGAAELIERMGPADLTLPEDRPTVAENLRKRLSGEVHSIRYEFRGVKKDDSALFVEVFGARTLYLGEPAIIGTLLDITDRKLAEQRLAEQTAELARSNAELQQFAYVASHDLQEPLRMITSYLQLLSRRYTGKLGGDADEFIGFAVDGASRMQRLINDLLAYSRVGTRGKEFVPLDSGKVLEEVILNLKTVIEEKGAIITCDPMPTVLADDTQLAQLFQNLIGNAIKFHGDKPPQVRIEARKDKAEWLFAVKDDGIGIPRQEFERIFQIFQRLHTRAEYPGTGIGLAVCKKIVERHGGRIWVESEPGCGASIYFTIPDGQISTSTR